MRMGGLPLLEMPNLLKSKINVDPFEQSCVPLVKMQSNGEVRVTDNPNSTTCKPIANNVNQPKGNQKQEQMGVYP